MTTEAPARPEPRASTQVVTSENLDAFQAQKLGVSAEAPADDKKPAEGAKADDKQEPAKGEKAEGKPEDEPKKGKLESRFSELAKQRKDAQEAADRERARADAAEAELRRMKGEPAQQQVEQDDGPAKPDPKKYADPFKYADDLAAWSAAKAVREAAQEGERLKAAEAAQRVTENWKQRVRDFEKAHPDYAEVLSSSTVTVHNAIRDALMESDVGPDILYAIAQDDDLAAKFAMPSSPRDAAAVMKQLRALGRLEAKYEKAAEKDPEPPKKEARREETPRAPDPITPVRGTARGDGPPPPNASAADYRAWRESQRRTH